MILNIKGQIEHPEVKKIKNLVNFFFLLNFD